MGSSSSQATNILRAPSLIFRCDHMPLSGRFQSSVFRRPIVIAIAVFVSLLHLRGTKIPSSPIHAYDQGAVFHFASRFRCPAEGYRISQTSKSWS